VIGLPEQGESSRRRPPQLKFTHKIIAPLDDVDPDAITSSRPKVKPSPTGNRNIFYVTPKSANMLRSLSSIAGGSGRQTMAEDWTKSQTPRSLSNIKHEHR